MATPQMHERIPRWTLGDRLRKARSLTGLNTREFADLIGVSQPTVTSAENDKAKVRKITLNAWSMATGVPVEWLLAGEEPDDDSNGPPDGGQSAPVVTQPTALDELAKRKRSRSGITTDRDTEDYDDWAVAA